MPVYSRQTARIFEDKAILDAIHIALAGAMYDRHPVDLQAALKDVWPKIKDRFYDDELVGIATNGPYLRVPVFPDQK